MQMLSQWMLWYWREVQPAATGMCIGMVGRGAMYYFPEMRSN